MSGLYGVTERRLWNSVVLLCLCAALQTTTAFILADDYSGYFVARNALAFQCAKDGFFRDPYNCTLFYRCADLTGDRRRFQLFQFSCPPGTVYDDAASVCNHPQVVPTCSGSGGHVTAVREGALGGVGGAGGAAQGVAKPVPGSRPTHLPIDKEVPGTNVPRPVLPNVPTSVANERCQRPGLFRSPDDCRRFYICVDVFGNGTTYQLCEYPCPQGSIFSNRLSLCTEPQNAEPCSDSQTQQTTTLRPPISPSIKPPISPPISPPTGGNVVPPTLRPPSPIVGPPDSFVCATSGYFRHPTNCSRYFQCVNLTVDNSVFQRYEFICSLGTAFHEAISQCDHPYNVPGCGGVIVEATSSRPSPSTVRPLPPASTLTPISPPAPSTISPSSSSQRPPVVTVPPSGNGTAIVGPPCVAEGYLPHPNNCSRFFRCINSSSTVRPNYYVKFEFACAPGTVFDPVINSCNHPDNVPSCGGIVIGSTTLPSVTRPAPTNPTYPPKPEVSTQSTTQQPPQTLPTTSQYPTLPPVTVPVTAPIVVSTTTQIITGVPTATPLPLVPGGNIPHPIIAGSECQKDGFFRNSNNCSQFYRCVDILGNGQRFHRYDFICGGGSVFDEAILACNHPSAVPGCGGIIVEGTTFTPIRPTTQQPGGLITSKPPVPPVSTLSPISSETTTIPTTASPATTTVSSITQSPLPLTTGTPSTSAPPRPTILPGPPCNKVGFFPHPLHCAHFFRCINLTVDHSSFQKVEFICGEGTVFDASIGICNFPEHVPGCEHHTTLAPVGSSAPASTLRPTTQPPLITTWPAFITSTQTSSTSTPLVTQPSSTAQSPITSPLSTTQLPITLPSSTTQSTSTIASTTALPLVTLPASSTVQPPTTASTTALPLVTLPASSTVQPPTTASSILPPPGPQCSESGFFRNPTNCSLFYRCVNTTIQGPPFIRYEFNCGLGSVFDTSINVCNHPQHVPGCEGNVVIPPQPSVIPGATTPSEIPPTSTQSTTTIIIPTGSSSSSTSVPPVTSPSSSTVSSITDSVTSANVGSSTTVIIPAVRPTLPPGNLVTVVPSPPSGGNESPIRCSADGFVRHPLDCAHFSRCVLNNRTNTFSKYDFVCGSGTVFDLTIMVCNHPSTVIGCEGYVSPTTTQSPCNHSVSTINPLPVTSTITNLPSSTLPSAIITTSTEAAAITTTTSEPPAITTVSGLQSSTTSQPISSSSPAGISTPVTLSPPSSLVTISTTQIITNPTTTTSAPLTSTTTRRPSSITSPCVVEGFFINPLNCSRFYRCIDLTGNGTRFQKINFNCPPGTYFDESIHVCNHAQLTPCNIGPVVQPLPTTPAGSAGGSTTSSTITTASSSSLATSTTERIEITSTVPTTTAPPTLPPAVSTVTPVAISTTSQLPLSSTTNSPPVPSSPLPTTAAPSSTSTSSPTTLPAEITTLTSTSTSTSTSSSISTSSSTTTSQRPPIIGEICLAEGKFTDPDTCEKFYLCQDLLGDGTNFHMCEVECPDDTFFSPALGYCSDRVLPHSCLDGQEQAVEHPTVEGALPFNHYLHLLNTRARRHSQS